MRINLFIVRSLTVALCRLCGGNKKLLDSHIIPEFLYSELYNPKHQMIGINGVGSRGWQTLQKGIREPLFCESCEQHFNEYCEKPFFKQWIGTSLLPDPWNATDVHWINVDYSSFKLFHLSIIFRAGVSSLPTFIEVDLGPHEDKLRQLIISCSLGENWQYPIFAYAVIHHETKKLIQMVSRPQRSKFGGRRCYGAMYGGAEWWVGVASDRNPEFEQIALQPDGRMPFTAVPWNEVGVVQQASSALKNKNS
jgi:hypothetical protein